jgi:hypothetical protein
MRLWIKVPSNPLLGHERLDRPAFDSRFEYGQEANLIITLRIWFVPIDRKVVGIFFPDTDGGYCKTGDWDEGNDPYEFEDFKTDACRLANKVWNNKLWLKTPASYTGVNWPVYDSKFRANVKCGLEVVPADSPREAHARVRVVKLADPGDSLAFRSNMTLWDNLDVKPFTFHPDQAPTSNVNHYSVPHEVGHLLGLHHSGELEKVGTCSLADQRKWTGADQYGNNAAAPEWIADNIMGLGTELHAINATPWVRRMVEHTEKHTKFEDWEVCTTAPPAVALP